MAISPPRPAREDRRPRLVATGTRTNLVNWENPNPNPYPIFQVPAINGDVKTVEAEKIFTVHGAHLKPSSLSPSGAASTAESLEQNHILLKPMESNRATSEIGLESSYREKAKPFQKVLLETPSVFAMFEVSQMVLRDPEVLWAFFTRRSAARKAVYALGFVKVDKSVSRDSDVGPGKDLEEFILKFCNDETLTVPDLHLKAVIERKLGVNCWFEEEIVHELMWGLNYALTTFVPEEEGYPVNEHPLSKHLVQKIKMHGFSVSLQKIDREFIDMLGYLVEAQCLSHSIPLFLHCKFDPLLHVTKMTTDIDFAKEVAALLKNPKMPVAEILKDGWQTKEDVQRYIEDFLVINERKNYAMAYFMRREKAASTEVDDLQETANELNCGETATEVNCGETAKEVKDGRHRKDVERYIEDFFEAAFDKII